jgi:heme oxygenase (mycobilin-producing)
LHQNKQIMSSKTFVAINYIRCTPAYRQRFEELFASRARAIDSMSGFHHMEVLKPQTADEPYLIVSHWDDEISFKAWTNSPAFLEGHKRGFEDIRTAKAAGEVAPMQSEFKTYSILTQ